MDKFLCAMSSAATSSAVSSNALGVSGEGSGVDFTAVFLMISLLIAIVIPVGFTLLGKIRHKGSLKQTLLGMFSYILFYMILAAGITFILLPGYSDQNVSSFEAMIYVMVQIVCLELGRFLFLRLTRKKHSSWGDGLLFGAGYCVMDTLVIAVIFLVPYLIVVLSSNGGQIDGMWRELRVFVEDANLVAGKEWRFIVKALVSLVFCGLQMSSTMLMFMGVQKRKYWLCVTPLIIDALIMIPNRMSSFDVWFWGNNLVILPYLVIITLLCALFAYLMWKHVYLAKEETINAGYMDQLGKLAQEHEQSEANDPYFAKKKGSRQVEIESTGKKRKK